MAVQPPCESLAMSPRDILLAFLVLFIWAGNIIAIKLSVTELAPLTALAVRFGLTGLVFLPFIRGLDKHTFRQLTSARSRWPSSSR